MVIGFSKVKAMNGNKDFILKLKIDVGDGSTQLRRVRLPRIIDAEGRVNFNELVGLVVTFVFPEGDRKRFYVRLTYLDSEEDRVTIGSSDELLDAIEQFSGKGVLRIQAEVKPRVQATTATSRSQHPGNSSTNPGSVAEVPIKQVLESFVGLLSQAVEAFQEGLAAPTPNGNAKAMSGSDGGDNVPARREIVTGANNVREPPNSTVAAMESKRFIHGRHTCDSCLATPIVGIRYHARNVPDYDLCSNCFDNYAGTHVVFDPVELDRDRLFQERWRRRYERRGATGLTRHSRECRQHGGGEDKLPSKEQKWHNLIISAPHCFPEAIKRDGTFDYTLGEAICRSLQDVVADKPSTECVSTSGVHSQSKSNFAKPPPPADLLIAASIEARQCPKSPVCPELEAAPLKDESTGAPEVNLNLEIPKVNGTNDANKSNLTPEQTILGYCLEQPKEENLDDSSKILDFSSVVQPTPTTAPEHVTPSNRKTEQSFASDAVGSGDDAMGGVLDTVADVITEMLSDAHDEIPTPEDTMSAEVSDRLILGSVKTDKSKDDDDVESSGSESWCIVSDDAQSTQSHRDEIARAAEVLGSVLFNSELKGLEESVSVMSCSDSVPSSVSAVSSVPSSIPSLLNSIEATDEPLGPWTAHLSRLRQLGFNDDSKNLDILERLAESSGADPDAVSVSQVVDELIREIRSP